MSAFMGDYKLNRPDPCKYQFDGATGDYLRAVTEQWLLVAPKANPAMLEIFADRDTPPHRHLVPWAGEFAGKYLTSAIQVLRATGDARLHAWLQDFVGYLVALQDDDGYLGPWPQGSHLTGRAPNVAGGGGTWDAWGHYHVMMGLLLWHASTGDDEALTAARRIGDLFCRLFLGDQEIRLVDTGETDKNLAPVHALALLHRRTGEQRYLDLAQQIVEAFAAEDAEGALLAGDYLRQALVGREFFEMPKPRWESLHPIMGLAELHAITGDPDYREAFERIWWSIVAYDRHNNGGFSAGEKATGNPYDPAPIETCCTIAWIATSVEMLKLTGNPVVADELELATLNSVLGMHACSGRWATYNTPSDGARFASAHQIVFQSRAGSPELNCCSVNSPRGLGMLSDWAVMQAEDGLYLNYYGPAQFRIELENGAVLTLRAETDYPISGRVVLHVAVTEPVEVPLHLRIPTWSRQTNVWVNGDPVADVEPGAYLAIPRRWQGETQVTLELDMALHLWQGDRECAGLTSVYCGPLLLAYDQRYNRDRTTTDPDDDEPRIYGGDPWATTGESLDVPTLDATNLHPQMVAWDGWLPPILLVEVETADGETVRLCDFASAGTGGTLYRSWLPVAHAPARPPFTRHHPLPTSHLP